MKTSEFPSKWMALLHERLRAVFGVDLRTLALFRTMLGAVLCGDSLHRFIDLRAFYTDAGVLPRSWLADLTGPWRFSLHFASGDAWWQALLLGIGALSALALMIGWRARLATFICLILTASLCARNPLILLGGDYLLCCLLFWALFLPVSARFSVDAAMSKTPPPIDNTHLSWASAALILQVLSVYFFSALLKTGKEWWPEGSAVWYTLSLDGYSWPWSHWLLAYPGLLKALTYFVYWLEYLGPLVALSPIFPRFCRFLVMFLLVCMQTGFLLLLAIGFFPFVSLTAASTLLGGWFWDWLARHAALGRGLRIYYDGDCAHCQRAAQLLRMLLILPRAQLAEAQSTARTATLMQANQSWVVIDADDRAQLRWPAMLLLLRQSPILFWLGALLSLSPLLKLGNAVHGAVAKRPALSAELAAAVLPAPHDRRFGVRPAWQALVIVVMSSAMAWNWATVGKLPFETFDLLSPVLYPLRLEQFWQMFAPFPFKDNGWYVLPGKLVDGSEVDVIRPRKPLSYDKPWSIAWDMPDMRWQVYYNRLYDERFAKNRNLFSRYLCREWNRSAAPGKRLVSFDIVYMLRRNLPLGETPHLERVVKWKHECVPPDVAAKAAASTTDPSGTGSSKDSDTPPSPPIAAPASPP